MSFHCNTHGWQHLLKSCPQCNTQHIQINNSSGYFDYCLSCGNTILPQGIPVMYSGPVCHCPINPENKYQRPASKEKK